MCFAAVVALALLDWTWCVIRDREVSFDIIDASLLGLIAYGSLSLNWSVNRNGGIQTVIIALACLAIVTHLKRYASQTLMQGIAVGICLGNLYALASNYWLDGDQWSGFGNRGYANETFTLCIPFMWLLWPLWRSCSWLARAFAALAVLVAAADFVYVFLYSPSIDFPDPVGWLARHLFAVELRHYLPNVMGWFVALVFLVIALAILAFRRGREFGWLCVAAGLALLILVVGTGWGPLYRAHHLDNVLIRTELWVNTEFMIADRPLFGHGAGSFIEAYPLYKEAHGGLFPFVNTAFESYVTEAEAAHNDPVQLVTELGIVGTIPFLAVIVFAIRAATRRMTVDRSAAAGGAALITMLTESLIEYPFQRAATLLLAVIALAMAAHGQSAGLSRWSAKLDGSLRYGFAPFSLAFAALLVFASYRQFEAENLLDRSRAPDVEASKAFNQAYEAYKLDPLERRIRTALPVLLDGKMRAYGVAAVPKAQMDEIFRLSDNGGHFNTSALVAKAQMLLQLDNGDDPEFSDVLADLKRGSNRVAAVYAIEARDHIIHKRYEEALVSIAEGKKFTGGVSAIVSADEAIKANLEELERVARQGLELTKQHQQPVDPPTQPSK